MAERKEPRYLTRERERASALDNVQLLRETLLYNHDANTTTKRGEREAEVYFDEVLARMRRDPDEAATEIDPDSGWRAHAATRRRSCARRRTGRAGAARCRPRASRCPAR